MSKKQLCYFSQEICDELYKAVEPNAYRYIGDGYRDKEGEPGWDIELDISADISCLEDLDPSKGSSAEINNSILVWKALHSIPPALATEDRFWTRLCHVECFEFSKKRWIDIRGTDEEIAKSASDHFFARSLTKFRDDNSISRLWWNAYVAKSLFPNDIEGALSLMLAKADIRANLVERPMTFSRLEIGRAILRKMKNLPDVYSSEKPFRVFMKKINKYGGGILFEALDDASCDSFMDSCWNMACSEMLSAKNI